jgi:hypothetical protein
VSRVTESATIVGTISNVGQPTTNRIAGTITYNSIVLYDASSNVCLTLSGYAFPFVMRRADVPAGSNVSAEPFDDGTVSFETVNTAGAAAIVTVTDATGTLPTNFQLSNSLYVDVVTSADHAGTITTCLPYPDADDDGFVDGTNPPLPEGQLQILHAENGVFVDRTVSRDPVNNVICAETSSLSEFAVGAGSTTTTTSTTSSTTTTTIPAGCDSTPRGTCRTANPAGSKVGIKDRTPDTADQVSWKWKGQATTLGDFGNPPATTGYAVCVYQGATLKLAARAPASAACGMKPCWKALGTNGYGYKDGALTPDGLSKVTLKAGATGRAQVAVKGKGANLPDGVLPLMTPVTIQLQATTGECWGATFGTAAVSDTGQFKATSDRGEGASATTTGNDQTTEVSTNLVAGRSLSAPRASKFPIQRSPSWRQRATRAVAGRRLGRHTATKRSRHEMARSATRARVQMTLEEISPYDYHEGDYTARGGPRVDDRGARARASGRAQGLERDALQREHAG